MPHPVDVAVVGAGPTGLVLAILLAQQGRTVVVLERQPAPYRLPRAVHFDHEVGRILQSCGIGDDLGAISEPGEIYEWRNAVGTTLLRFGRRGIAPSGWPESSMFSQPQLEALLERRAGELPNLDIRRGVTVDAIAGSTIAAHDADGQRVAVDARFIVGCDGANSTVRDLVGIDLVDLGFFYDWLIVDVILDEPRVFDPLNLQICDPARPTTLVSGGPGRRRWEFMCLPGEDRAALDDEARAWELLEPWDVHPHNTTLERHAVYTFQARYASRWRNGPVFIAGDAAHQMPPFAGLGMCAGIRDAANLAWKLDEVIGGRAGDALLDSYEVERLPIARQAIEFSMELGKVICVPDPAEAAARDELMAAGVGDEPTGAPDLPGYEAGFTDPSSTAAGALFPQGTIDGRRADEVDGLGWRLVTASDADAGEVGVRVLRDPSLASWFREHDVTWALRRPDFHLYGTTADSDGARGLVDRMRTALETTDPTEIGAPT